MTDLVKVKVTRGLKLEVFSIKPWGKIEFRLTRLEAQRLANTLNEFAGVATKGFIPHDREDFIAENLTPDPDAQPPLKVGTIHLRGGR